MHELPLLINIAVALVVAFIGGVVARRIGLPTIVGYMLAGIAIGPFTPGFEGDMDTIGQLAELGVIFLMFGVGLHFSLQDFWKVRSVALLGGRWVDPLRPNKSCCINFRNYRWFLGVPPC
jgi:K+:H+ antiporter